MTEALVAALIPWEDMEVVLEEEAILAAWIWVVVEEETKHHTGALFLVVF